MVAGHARSLNDNKKKNYEFVFKFQCNGKKKKNICDNSESVIN